MEYTAPQDSFFFVGNVYGASLLYSTRRKSMVAVTIDCETEEHKRLKLQKKMRAAARARPKT